MADARRTSTLVQKAESLVGRLVGLNDAQIARVLGRSHDAVRKEQSRSIKALRSFVAGDVTDGDTHA